MPGYWGNVHTIVIKFLVSDMINMHTKFTSTIGLFLCVSPINAHITQTYDKNWIFWIRGNYDTDFSYEFIYSTISSPILLTLLLQIKIKMYRLYTVFHIYFENIHYYFTNINMVQ